ncbi:MAG: hypothetical protein HFG70_10550 [Hungatella sp.]|jgi:uncharacterized protein YkwD|nr:hypothetical protein [Hungatella sp.]
MKRLALYAAAAAMAMTGTTTITSQAAVGTFVIGSNCPTGSSSGNPFSGGGDGILINGNPYSANQILQNIFAGNSGFGCPDSTGGGNGQIFSGGCGNSWIPDYSGSTNGFLPGCSGDQGDILIPNLPGTVICPDSSDCPGDILCPDIQNPGIQNPDIQNPGTQNPGTQNPGIQNPGTQNPGTQNPDQGNSSYIWQVIELVNEERAKAGLAPVTEAADVSAAADVRAQEITRSFSHTRPNGSNYSTALDESGVKYMGSGENIAYGQKTPEAVMRGWMNSQGHRANILNGNYTKIGVGYYQNANGVGYWVQLFTY